MPQFCESLSRSLQIEVALEPAEVHTLWPVGHVAAHVPPAVQTSVPGQSVVHAPAEQICPAVQTWPHVPQLLGSDPVFAHWSPHATYPEPQNEHSRPPSGCNGTPQPLISDP